ncbi:MAG: virulence RhuM family protein, partial [Treponemataceae bacterium]|nr:virulence RhuM family protein [Treponemataceae bacterium]
MAKKVEKKDISIRSSAAEYLTFVAATGDDKNSVEVRYEDENIWVTQKMLAVLYEVDVRTINYHIKKIFEDSELTEDSVIRKFRITAEDGKSYDTMHYNLQMIIAVGFKVNSERAVQFRKWVNQIAKDYTIQGWVLDSDRLKNGGSILTKDYFKRLLEEIREIRISERQFYQKITDLYATAIDYDKTAKTTKDFFAKVQNKLHWAIHKHTAAELIYERADSTKENMGLTSWEGSPNSKIRKSDVSIAKNYLSKDELHSLELIVSGYLDFAEMQANRNIPMTMEDWAKHLDRI